MVATLVWTNGAGSGGTGWGFAADVAFGFGDIWDDIVAEFKGQQYARKVYQYGIPYPASTVQMQKSIDQGEVTECATIRAVHTPGEPLFIVGYSEGSLVTGRVWRDHIWSPDGDLHDLLPDVLNFGGVIVFGDPMRSPGIANGNVVAGFPVPKNVQGTVTGGISGTDDLTPAQTPACVLSCTNDGDVYGDCAVGQAPWIEETGIGHDMRIIFNIVQSFTINNIGAIAMEVVKTLGIVDALVNPLELAQLVLATIKGATGDISSVPVTGATTVDHAVALLLAVYDFGAFVVSGFGPHGDYEKMVPAMIDWVNGRVRAWQASLVS